MQRALLEVLLLAVISGLLGTWVVLRQLAFFSHAVGSATFPGMVVAGATGIAAPVLALLSAFGFGLGIRKLARAERLGSDGGTGLLLTAMLALGVVLASDVFASGAGIDRLLFGGLIGLTDGDLTWSAATVFAVITVTVIAWRSWSVQTFDPQSAEALGTHRHYDLLLFAAVALAVVAALPVAGALLVSALVVVPAATARFWANGLLNLSVGSVVLAALEGIAGLTVSYQLDLPPGPTIAVIAGVIFAIAAIIRARRARLK